MFCPDKKNYVQDKKYFVQADGRGISLVFARLFLDLNIVSWGLLAQCLSLSLSLPILLSAPYQSIV